MKKEMQTCPEILAWIPQVGYAGLGTVPGVPLTLSPQSAPQLSFTGIGKKVPSSEV